MKRTLTKKVSGYIVSIELMAAMLVWCALMCATVYVINAQRWQKLMYNSFCSAATQTARWGGSQTNLRSVNGKTQDIAEEMEKSIQNASGQHVRIDITPTKVTNADKTVTVRLTWTPINADWFSLFSSGRDGDRHTIEASFDTIAKPGILL